MKLAGIAVRFVQANLMIDAERGAKGAEAGREPGAAGNGLSWRDDHRGTYRLGRVLPIL
ncbi:hypothetical protein ML5_5483 [Micromonospora sp. L5]|nr:hypothetical protein ML5_5483 [Micromonospora sp. L5]